MLSPLSSSAEKKAAKQSWRLTMGPQNQLRIHSHSHVTQPCNISTVGPRMKSEQQMHMKQMDKNRDKTI
jgi:hypothetical protein